MGNSHSGPRTGWRVARGGRSRELGAETAHLRYTERPAPEAGRSTRRADPHLTRPVISTPHRGMAAGHRAPAVAGRERIDHRSRPTAGREPWPTPPPGTTCGAASRGRKREQCRGPTADPNADPPRKAQVTSMARRPPHPRRALSATRRPPRRADSESRPAGAACTVRSRIGHRPPRATLARIGDRPARRPAEAPTPPLADRRATALPGFDRRPAGRSRCAPASPSGKPHPIGHQRRRRPISHRSADASPAASRRSRDGRLSRRQPGTTRPGARDPRTPGRRGQPRMERSWHSFML